MTKPPDLISHRRPSVPPVLADLIMRCLKSVPPTGHKTPVSSCALSSNEHPGLRPRPTATKPVPRQRWGIPYRHFIVAGAIATAAIGIFLWRSRAARGKTRVPIHKQLTFSGKVQRQELSPDGQLLAYVERGDTLQLLVKDLTGGTVIPITAMGQV